MGRYRVGVLCVATLLCATAVSAQVRITGAVSGTVVDPSGAVVPGATVVLKDEGTGITKEAVTNDSGHFLFPNLDHGKFQVTVTLQGFQTAQIQGGRCRCVADH